MRLLFEDRVGTPDLGDISVQRIYLDELGNPDQQPVGISLMQLTLASDAQTAPQAQRLIERVQQEDLGLLSRNDIIDIITTIAVYKFTNLSREEVEAMLGINLQETKVYQEAKAEGRQEGRQEGQLEIVLRLLTRRLGTLELPLPNQIRQYSSAQLADLSEALLDFSSPTDLLTWLQDNPPIAPQ